MSGIDWKIVKEYEDITFKMADGVARIAFNRPEVRNAFRPKTVDELLEALIICHESQEIGVVLITGEGPSPKDGGWAFCSGGDQRVRAKRGYQGLDGVNKFNILDVQRQIRFMNKVVIAVVPGWAVGGGHSLQCSVIAVVVRAARSRRGLQCCYQCWRTILLGLRVHHG